MVDPKVLIIKSTPFIIINIQYSNYLLYTHTREQLIFQIFDMQHSPNFSQLLTYILDNVLISTSVEHTCYFPSFSQLQKVFIIYAGDHIADQLAHLCRTETQDEVQDFMLCYIILKQYSRNTQHPKQVSTAVHQIIRMAHENLGINISLDKAGEKEKKSCCVIHQGNLINLLNVLVALNGKKQTIYDFNQVEVDGNSLCFQEYN